MAGDFDVSDADYEADKWGKPYTCRVCGDEYIKGEECRAYHSDRKCCHEYESKVLRPVEDSPRDAQPARLTGEVL